MKHMTRKEIFMAALAKGEEAPIKPLTREEQLLAAHAKREASGGGTGGGGVTSWNNLDDKPFGEELASVAIFDGDIAMQYPVGEEGDSAYFFDSKLNLTNGEEYRVVMDGTINGNPFSFNEVIICNSNELKIDSNLEILKDRVVSWEKKHVFVGHLSIEHEEVTTKTLDPKYVGVLGVVFSREYDEAAEAEVAICTKTFKELKNAWERRIPIVAFENDGFSQTRFTSIDTSTESSQIVSFMFFTEWGHYDVHRDGTVEYVSSE